MSEHVFMSKRHKRFKDKLNEIMKSESICTRSTKNGKHVGVNIDYIRTKIVPRTQYLFMYRTRSTKPGRRGKTIEFFRIDGVLLAHNKTIDGQRVFYIDLVCSKHRKGSALLRDAEDFAKKQGYELVALRAAMPKLLKYYRGKGYRRLDNACTSASRTRRSNLRQLDDNAILEFKGRKIEMLGEGWWMSKCL